MKTSKKIPPYRDGYVSFVKALSTNISSFGAPKNTRSESDTDHVVMLAYDRMTIRQRDLEWAYNNDKTLSLKIRCPYHGSVSTDMQAIVADTLYDVTQVDPDINNNQMFVYLQENRKL
ncbi:MAG: hypothetical protein IJ227_02000 [Mogibacterium sp.]|nr:hypothetical protein [Mogibacterium sp.]